LAAEVQKWVYRCWFSATAFAQLPFRYTGLAEGGEKEFGVLHSTQVQLPEQLSRLANQHRGQGGGFSCSVLSPSNRLPT
jgi:hypothetical protein